MLVDVDAFVEGVMYVSSCNLILGGVTMLTWSCSTYFEAKAIHEDTKLLHNLRAALRKLRQKLLLRADNSFDMVQRFSHAMSNREADRQR
jgi:hypothetical protein